MSTQDFRSLGDAYRTSPAMRALLEQHQQMVSVVAALPPKQRAVIADQMGVATRRDWPDQKNQAIHDLEYDHTLEEIGELVGRGRNVVLRGLQRWRERRSVVPHPLMGKRDRIAQRR